MTEVCRQALSQKTVSQEVILNILNRARDHQDCPPLESLRGRLRLSHEPIADCARYDLLRGQAGHDA